MLNDAPAAVSLRFLAYTLVVLAFMASLPLLAQPESRYFAENGPVEWLQWGLLIGSVVLLSIGARRAPQWRESFLVWAALLGMASIRELDSLLNRTIPLLGWKLPFSVLLLVSGAYAVRHRAALQAQASALASSAPAALMWAGFLVVMPFAQLLGHGDFLQSVMGESYDNKLKRVIEETCETVGYMILLTASVESWVWAAARRPAPADERSLRREER